MIPQVISYIFTACITALFHSPHYFYASIYVLEKKDYVHHKLDSSLTPGPYQTGLTWSSPEEVVITYASQWTSHKRPDISLSSSRSVWWLSVTLSLFIQVHSSNNVIANRPTCVGIWNTLSHCKTWGWCSWRMEACWLAKILCALKLGVHCEGNGVTQYYICIWQCLYIWTSTFLIYV